MHRLEIHVSKIKADWPTWSLTEWSQVTEVTVAQWSVVRVQYLDPDVTRDPTGFRPGGATGP